MYKAIISYVYFHEIIYLFFMVMGTSIRLSVFNSISSVKILIKINHNHFMNILLLEDFCVS